jgi:dihydropteroate synthase
MGVLNVTPDSFSDGGELPTTRAVVTRARQMLAAGADVLDLGGESTRPGAAPVSVEEELRRVLPALAALRRAFPAAPISIDTHKPAVAAAAIRAGADLINDIWGATHGLTAAQRRTAIKSLTSNSAFRSSSNSKLETRNSPAPNRKPPTVNSKPAISSEMASTAATLCCPLILMHNRPDRAYRDFWADFLADLQLSLALARAAGIPKHQLWLDPGFGFAKEPAHNLEVVKNLSRVAALGYPVLLGASRKSTIGRVLDDAPAHDRLEGTAATLVWGIQQGAAMVRLHDLPEHRRTLRMADALRAGLAWQPPK